MPTDTATTGPTYAIPAHLLGDAVKKIEAANRRLARVGGSERFTYDVVREMRTRISADADGLVTTAYEVAVLTLSAPVIAVGKWRFLAAVDQAETGLVTRTALGVDLAGWRPADMRCEHCGHNRARKHTYLIEDATGTRMQIGSTCIVPFLGVAPAGLWTLDADLLVDEKYDADLWIEGGAAGGQAHIPTQHVIALALAISNDGRNFVSRAAAIEVPATADQVTEALNPSRTTPAAWVDEVTTGARERIQDGRVDAALATIRAVEGTSDWAANLRTIAAGEWCGYTHLALLVSGLVVIRRQIEAAARQSAPAPVAGYAAPVKASVKGTHVTITGVSCQERENLYTGAPEIRTQVTMADDAGHQLIWWTTTDAAADLDPGQSATLTGGTVKEHGTYRGVDQTVVTRCKLALDAPALTDAGK
jgi:hypothetical protein